jgi:hypothetical protein
MAINDWWTDRPDERYWMVAPPRGGIVDALQAPRRSGDDERFEWTYDLVQHVQPGDTVFIWSWSGGKPAITGWSRAIGPLESVTDVWREGAKATSIPLWRMPMSPTLTLQNPITVPMLRRFGADLVRVEASVRADTDGPIYFPFIGGADTIAVLPSYLTKFPRDLFALLSANYGFDFTL